MVGPLFVCHSSKDIKIALEVVAALEARELPCWISARDVQAGQNYQEAIVSALDHACGIVFLFSENSSQSAEIRKELSIAGSVLAPVFPLRLCPITPTGALRYELATRQWIDLFPDEGQALDKLADTIRQALSDPAATSPGRSDPSLGGPAMPDAKSMRSSTLKRDGLAIANSELEALRVLLAHHVGPIAKFLLQKATQQTNSVDEFCESVAAHIKTPAERALFLREAHALLKK